jgi:hypothetical protein
MSISLVRFGSNIVSNPLYAAIEIPLQIGKPNFLSTNRRFTESNRLVCVRVRRNAEC